MIPHSTCRQLTYETDQLSRLLMTDARIGASSTTWARALRYGSPEQFVEAVGAVDPATHLWWRDHTALWRPGSSAFQGIAVSIGLVAAILFFGLRNTVSQGWLLLCVILPICAAPVAGLEWLRRERMASDIARLRRDWARCAGEIARLSARLSTARPEGAIQDELDELIDALAVLRQLAPNSGLPFRSFLAEELAYPSATSGPTPLAKALLRASHVRVVGGPSNDRVRWSVEVDHRAQAGLTTSRVRTREEWWYRTYRLEDVTGRVVFSIEASSSGTLAVSDPTGAHLGSVDGGGLIHGPEGQLIARRFRERIAGKEYVVNTPTAEQLASGTYRDGLTLTCPIDDPRRPLLIASLVLEIHHWESSESVT